MQFSRASEGFGCGRGVYDWLVGFLLHRRDGVGRRWCGRCGRLHEGGCVGGDRRREYVPGGPISMWNREAYERYERSEEGLEKRREWEREMLSQVDEA